VSDDEYRDEELEKMFAEGPAASDDEQWDIDWSPEQGLVPTGERDALLADVKKGETSGFGGATKKPAIIWSVTDVETGRTLTKAIPMRDGNGIERLNIDCARAFGVEPVEKPNGGWSIPGTQVRSHIGEKCRIKVSHWTDSNDNLRDSLDTILPSVLGQEALDLPEYPDEPEP
jgi:hypothetical protein